MGTGGPPPVYVRVRRYGWRRREHAWTGGRVHRGPGAIATMMHAAARSRQLGTDCRLHDLRLSLKNFCPGCPGCRRSSFVLVTRIVYRALGDTLSIEMASIG